MLFSNVASLVPADYVAGASFRGGWKSLWIPKN